jgi:hypothetical protein
MDWNETFAHWCTHAADRMDWYSSKRILALSVGLGLLNGILQDTYAYCYGVSVKDQTRERPRSETFELWPGPRFQQDPPLA